MRITEITVSAGRVIPHPRESYANLRPMLSLRASVDETEDISAAVSLLQGVTEALLASHVAHLMATIEAEYQAERKRQEEAYDQRQRSLASVADADALEDDEIDELEEEDIPFETPGR
jgi:hypothetical protein